MRSSRLALALGLLLLLPGIALAHLGLSRSTPSNGAHLAEAPRELRLTFTEAVDVAVTRVRLLGPSDGEVPISALRHPADSTQVIVATVNGALQPGAYRIEWQVVGRDGHPVRGTITYVIAPGATGLDDPATATTARLASPPDSTPGHEASHHDPRSMPVGGSLDADSPPYVAIRFVQFSALLAVLGALAFSIVVLGSLGRRGDPVDPIDEMRLRAARLGSWAAITLLVTAFARLYAQSVAMHGTRDALDTELVTTMIAHTGWGSGWMLEVLAVLVVIAGLTMARRGRSGGWALAAGAGLALAASPALSGHAAATPGIAMLAIVADTLHVIGAAGWLGSLLFVIAVGVPIAMRLDPDRRGPAVARLVNAFSPAALVFAGILSITGVFAGWLHIGFSSALWTSDYGRTLLIKLAILSIVVMTGAWNWLRVKPALGDERSARRIQRSARVELAVGVLVVIVTAILVATPPPTEVDSGATGTTAVSAIQ